MRIISGNFKGKKILLPKDKLTRPLKDLTKESIFNIIQHSKLLDINLENSKILDLFSGVGSFGLECLSRGAKNVTFFESYKEVLKVLKKNIESLKFQSFSSIIEKDIFSIKENTCSVDITRLSELIKPAEYSSFTIDEKSSMLPDIEYIVKRLFILSFWHTNKSIYSKITNRQK